MWYIDRTSIVLSSYFCSSRYDMRKYIVLFVSSLLFLETDDWI
jgi:hypothetical protein